jgi:hypothetical protein
MSADAAREVVIAEVQYGERDDVRLLRDLRGDARAAYEQDGVAALPTVALFQVDLVAVDPAFLARAIKQRTDGIVRTDAEQIQPRRYYLLLVDGAGILHVRQVALRLLQPLHETRLQRFAEQPLRQLSDPAGVLQDLHGLDT